MNLAMGILFLWVGAALIYIAVHGLTLKNGAPVKTPWDAFAGLMDKIRTS